MTTVGGWEAFGATTARTAWAAFHTTTTFYHDNRRRFCQALGDSGVQDARRDSRLGAGATT